MLLDENDTPISPRKIPERTGIILRPESVEFPRQFLADAFRGQAENITKALNEVYEIDKKYYLRTMIEVAKIVTPKESKQTHISVNTDMRELATLSSMNDAKPVYDRIPADPIQDDFVETPSSHKDVMEDIDVLLGRKKIPEPSDEDEDIQIIEEIDDTEDDEVQDDPI